MRIGRGVVRFLKVEGRVPGFDDTLVTGILHSGVGKQLFIEAIAPKELLVLMEELVDWQEELKLEEFVGKSFVLVLSLLAKKDSKDGS